MRTPTLLMTAIACGLVHVACTSGQRISMETAAANVLVSDDEEKQLGLQVKQELDQKQHVKYLSDPMVNS